VSIASDHIRAHIRALPKAELHMHVEGAAPASTVADLARKHGVDLGVDDPADLYRYRDLGDFLRVFDLVCQVLRDVDDIHRVTYESLAIARAAGVRYREMFFSPTFLLRHGVAFATIWEGIAAGVRDAETDCGIVCRMILDVDKPSGPAAADTLIDLACGCDRDILIGIGGDAGEQGFDLAAFARPFERARRSGFRTTMHLGEEGPADDIRIGLDVVGVERVDHGFSVMDDSALVRDVRERHIPFTVCPTSNMMIGLVPTLESHPVIAMRDAGILTTLNSDNAAMFGIDLADEYERVARAFELSIDDLEAFSLASLDASWLDPASRTSMRTNFEAEFARLRTGSETGGDVRA
jgi:adenosine deaminase